jgi:acyl carrier protein
MNEVSRNSVRQFLLTRYAQPIEQLGMDADEVPDDFDFLLSGVIDSFGILEMISSIEEEFGIQLDMATLDAEEITILGPLSQHVAQNTEADLSAGKPITFLYQNASIFLHGFSHQLGRIRRDLNELKADNLLAGTVETLSAVGYRYCYGLGDDETLVTLATKPLAAALERVAEPRALVFQHCRAESAVLPFEPDDKVGFSRNRYLGGAVMQELAIDHLPYFCSFASGCAGFLSILIAAGGLFTSSNGGPAVCVMADYKPPGLPFDMLRERILGSDHSSAFVIGHQDCGYQLLGVSYYSTTRKLVPLVEIVKRTVEMIEGLATELGLDLAARDVVIHYPNIFPEPWEMVTGYLHLPHVQHVMDEMSERAHCGSTDSVISLTKFHRGQRGRIHIVINYGVGLHLGVCILEERGTSKGNV